MPAPIISGIDWAVTYDQTTSTLTLYEDGMPVASNSAQPIQGASTTLTVGASGALDDFFDGSIDDIRVWNIARSASDIQANYGLATLGTGVQGLLADWAFTEGQGNGTADTSGNGNTLTFVGSPAWSQSPASSLTITITGGVDLTIPDLPGGPDLSINGKASFHINLNQGTLDLNVDGTASLAPIGNFLTLDGTVHFDPAMVGANGVIDSSRYLRHLRRHHPPELGAVEPGDHPERGHGPAVQLPPA